ncbi:hypothetical protein K6119_07725 [Paracrocinitomix mangrovi]|uniref:hypothetical protein n=1 Tax=Paracrocinitomix mangrovi TaxID=2862509 RepID=UPI001C8EF75C|nr:hypothetical protein [Paracrocinitomix mangrovi]UKN03402.1 hypothetical protein K6119_07725 [Paracrocinitomix mangrovi]
MEIKKHLKNPFVQQYIVEIALPLVGYLLFDWTLAVIIAFYYMDFFGSEISRHRRHYKIRAHWNESMSSFYISIGVSVLVFLALTFIAWYFLNQSDLITNSTHIDEIIHFLKNEGWILLPLVYLANYMKDVMTFYAPRRYTKFNYKNTLKAYYIELSVLITLTITGFVAWTTLLIPTIPALIGFVVVKLAFDLLLVRKLKKFSQKF